MPSHLTLPARCTLVEIAELHGTLSRALSDGAEDLRIDAGAVEEADLSLLQLLIATGRSLDGTGRALEIVPSQALRALAARGGFVLDTRGRPVAP